MELVTDVIHSHANTKSDQLALAWVNQKGEITETLTYKDLSSSINKISAYLSQSIALNPGDKAVLLFLNGIDFIQTFLACLQIGVIPIPLKHPRNKNKFSPLLPIIDECQPRCILSSDILETDEICLTPWVKIDKGYERIDFQKPKTYSELAFLQFTSGSISSPKGVMISHENLIHNLKLIGTYLTNKPHDQITASWLPHYHDMGLIGAYLANLYHGNPGYYMAPTSFMTNPNGFIQLISDVRATVIQCPNAAYEFMVSQWDNRDVNLKIGRAHV